MLVEIQENSPSNMTSKTQKLRALSSVLRRVAERVRGMTEFDATAFTVTVDLPTTVVDTEHKSKLQRILADVKPLQMSPMRHFKFVREDEQGRCDFIQQMLQFS